MMPAASVSGLYFASPEARYFMVGRIGADQVKDYAERKGMPLEEVERWLAPNLVLRCADGFADLLTRLNRLDGSRRVESTWDGFT